MTTMNTTNTANNISQKDNSKTSLLKNVLYADFIFTSLSGLSLIIWNTQITSFLGWSTPSIILVLGMIFIAYAAFLFTVARQNPPNTLLVKIIIATAVVWVIESCILLLLPSSNFLALSTGGKWAVAILADIVAIFGISQFFGLRRLKS